MFRRRPGTAGAGTGAPGSAPATATAVAGRWPVNPLPTVRGPPSRAPCRAASRAAPKVPPASPRWAPAASKGCAGTVAGLRRATGPSHPRPTLPCHIGGGSRGFDRCDSDTRWDSGISKGHGPSILRRGPSSPSSPANARPSFASIGSWLSRGPVGASPPLRPARGSRPSSASLWEGGDAPSPRNSASSERSMRRVAALRGRGARACT